MTIQLCANAEDLSKRFELSDGQIRGDDGYRNLWWELNGMFFGFGDISRTDILNIAAKLAPDDIFQGWNQHHGSEFQQTTVPMVRIEFGRITGRIELLHEMINEDPEVIRLKERVRVLEDRRSVAIGIVEKLGDDIARVREHLDNRVRALGH